MRYQSCLQCISVRVPPITVALMLQRDFCTSRTNKRSCDASKRFLYESAQILIVVLVHIVHMVHTAQAPQKANTIPAGMNYPMSRTIYHYCRQSKRFVYVPALDAVPSWLQCICVRVAPINAAVMLQRDFCMSPTIYHYCRQSKRSLYESHQ